MLSDWLELDRVSMSSAVTGVAVVVLPPDWEVDGLEMEEPTSSTYTSPTASELPPLPLQDARQNGSSRNENMRITKENSPFPLNFSTT